MTLPVDTTCIELSRVGEGFRAVEQLASSGSSHVVRAVRLRDGLPVVLKIVEGEQLTPQREARLRAEYALASVIDAPGVARAVDLASASGALVAVFLDRAGESLRRLAPKVRAPGLFLPVALSAAEALVELHRHGVIHKNLTPDHIIWNSATGAAEVIDLSIAVRLPREAPALVAPSVIEGTLPYVSPEQTGRMNLPIDARSDLYSLGVTFFEVLTGRLPFEQEDALALVHAHLAHPAPPLRTLRPDVPPVLEAIVARLLAKSPDDRYQSAHGLASDLWRALGAWSREGRMADLTLGVDDRVTTLRLRDRLYGRDGERAALLEAFEAAAQGQSGLALVSGYPGIGKSALVRELHRPITARRGLFGAGKFDQVARGGAYAALSQALGAVMQQLLCEPEARLRELRGELAACLGDGAGAAVEVAPGLEVLLGGLPPLPPLTGLESQRRFHEAVTRLVAALARPERPLVLFLDDLQWSDAASLSLLTEVLAGGRARHLLVIGAYRDREVGAGHPLLRTLASLDTAGLPVARIELAPLRRGDLLALLGDTLATPPETLGSLADVVQSHTDGNPFFVRQFLREIHRQGLLRFDHDTARWCWDLPGIAGQGFTDNVVELLLREMRRLPASTLRVVQVAACIGHSASIELIGGVLGEPAAGVAEAMQAALEAGMLERVGASARAGASSQGAAPANPLHRFVHDRLQQAAYETLSDEARAPLHLAIGRALLAAAPAVRDERLFEIVSQLDRGRSLVVDEAERVELIGLNLEAASKARRAVAFDSAAEFLAVARELVGRLGHRADAGLRFEVLLAAAECAYLLGRFDEADAIYPDLEAIARGRSDELAIGLVQSDHYLLQARHLEGVEVTRRCLALVGTHIPQRADDVAAALERELARVEQLLAGRPIESIVEGPISDDPAQVATVRLAYGAFLNGFLSGQGALAFLGLAIGARASIEHGNTPLSGYLYVGQGIVLTQLRKAYADGYRFGRTGVQVAERFADPSARSKTNFFFAADLHSFTRPLREGQAYYDRAYQLALDSGDWVTLGYVVAQSASDRLTSGVPLGALQPDLEAQRQLLERAHNRDWMDVLQATALNPIRRLRGEIDEVDGFDTPSFAYGPFLERHEGNNFFHAWAYAGPLRVVVLLGLRDTYEVWAERVKLIEDYVPTHAKVAEACFFGALMRLELAAGVEGEARASHLAEAARLIGRLRELAAACPENVAHRLEVALGAEAWSRGEWGQAVVHLDAGARLAREAGFPQVEALALELHARVWLAQGRRSVARPLLHEARGCLAGWGATAVVRRLEREHEWAFRAEPGHAPAASTPRSDPPLIDVTSVKLASRSLAASPDAQSATLNLLQIARLNAGAERCVLIEASGDEGLGQIAAIVSEGGATPLTPISLGSAEAEALLPCAVARLVLRSQTVVVLDDAGSSGDFQHEPLIMSAGIRSVLCLPLHGQGRLVGALYLDNRLSEAVFTPARADLLQILGAQLAVTLGMARSLREKETLLREVHHRVKNNLQIISSLLSMQADQTTSAPERHLLRDSVMRVRSMALVHQQLYGVDAMDRVELDSYARELVVTLQAVMAPGVRVRVDAGRVDVPIDVAIPLGLVLNELLTNAFKYGQRPASSEGGHGEGEGPSERRTGPDSDVVIEIARDEAGLRLAVIDAGAGVPPGFDPRRAANLGLQLVLSLTRQLRGTLRFDADRGTRAVVSCPLPGR